MNHHNVRKLAREEIIVMSFTVLLFFVLRVLFVHVVMCVCVCVCVCMRIDIKKTERDRQADR